jgi:hypothetical protein
MTTKLDIACPKCKHHVPFYYSQPHSRRIIALQCNHCCLAFLVLVVHTGDTHTISYYPYEGYVSP